MLNKTQLLFLVILIEGYVVLASELIVMRLLIPFVGSGTEIISIIISAVLLPLAVGYHYGGSAFKRAYARTRKDRRNQLSIRKILLKNILTSLFILSIGLSYVFLEIFFEILSIVGIHNRLAQTAIFSAIFLVTPVFLLGQTVPLISNYFSRKSLSEITGRMLFFSTTGSFLGSVFSTIVLMTLIGVHNTVIVTMGLLGFLVVLLVRRAIAYEIWVCAFIFLVLFLLNGSPTMKELNIVSNNAYNTAMVDTDKKTGTTTLYLNRSTSAAFDKEGNNQFDYSKFFESNFIAPLAKTKTVHDILIVGAGGFSAGYQDKVNHYIYVDIDKALKEVSEKYFRGEKLPANKQFVAASARAFVKDHDKKYDLIFIDTFTNVISVPMETTTREFLLDVKKLLKDNGVLVINMIASPDFRDKFSVRYDNTFASVFPNYSRQIITDFSPWADTSDSIKLRTHQRNVFYIYFNRPLTNDDTVYTDDLNTFSLDRN